MIDGGPTVLTMRWVFEELFAAAGAKALSEHVTLEPSERSGAACWSAAERLDLHRGSSGLGRCRRPILGRGGSQALPRLQRRGTAHLRDAGEAFHPLTAARSRSRLPPRTASAGCANARINPFETMWAGLGRHFRDPRLQQLFGRYATYCGSSPFLAPATLMLVAHVEQEGVWTVKGGMHELALALARSLAEQNGVEIRYRGGGDRH
jgi:1-hydroxycarotenoid 3,4-desaturase